MKESNIYENNKPNTFDLPRNNYRKKHTNNQVKLS